MSKGKNKDRIFHEEIFELYAKVLKGDIASTEKFKEIYFKYYPNQKWLTTGHYSKKEYLSVMYNHLIITKVKK